MALQLNDTAPDFEADTTEGRIRFHDWIGDSWAVLFSHPKDFTPVCTTELGYMAKVKPEFDRRGVKIIGLSVDPTDRHADWAKDIEETQGQAPNYPIVADSDFTVSKAYGMLASDVEGDPLVRTPADNQTVRNVFVIGPDKKIKLILVYPMTTGRNFDEVLRVIDSLQLTAKHKVATPVNWKQGEDVIIAWLGLGRRGDEGVSGRLGIAEAGHPERAAAAVKHRGRGDGELRRSARRPPCRARHQSRMGLNAHAAGELIGLKVGLHAGACPAVTLNDRLDYFGQTVNIAARVQALAGADEIVVTDDVLSLPGAAELVSGLQIDPGAVALKGIAGDVAVHRLRTA